jgi:transcriptional regulator with XRE-family HTH domain
MAADSFLPNGAQTRALRKQHKLSTKGLAHAAAVSESIVKKAEDGTRKVTKSFLESIAHALGVSVDTVIASTKPEVIVSSPESALRLYYCGRHTIQALRLAGADCEYFPPHMVHATIDQSRYNLPDEIINERAVLIARFEEEAQQHNRMFWDGPNTRLIHLRVSPLDSTEQKHLYLRFGQIGWHDFMVVHTELVPRAIRTGTLERFVNLERVSAGNITDVRFTNICDTMTVLFTEDGFVVFARRGRNVSVKGGMFSAISENIHPFMDRSLISGHSDNSPFSAVRRGVEEEISPELARRIAPGAVLLLGMDFNLDFFHPDMLFAVAVPCGVEEVLRIAREFPGKDYFEGKLQAVGASRTNPTLDTVLSSNNWDIGGKACLVRAIEFFDAVEKRHKINTADLARKLAAGDTSWME